MPQVRIRYRIVALVLALCAGGYALAVAQPAKPPASAMPQATTADSPLLSEPKTPVETFDAAVLTQRLYRPALTKRYLQKFLQSNPSDAVLLELRDRYGSSVFLQFARDPALNPEGTTILERVTAASKRQSEDPTYIDSLIANLFGQPEDRDAALEMLKNLGPVVVPRLLQHVAAPKGNESSDVLVQAIASLGAPVEPVLFGALDSSNNAIRVAAIQALGLIGDKNAALPLLGPAFDDRQPAGIRDAAQRALARIQGLSPDRGEQVSAFGAAEALKKATREMLANRTKWPTEGGLVEMWAWSEGTKTVVLLRVPPPAASMLTGLRYATEALALSPEDHEAQVLFLAMAFAWDASGPKEKPSPRIGPGTTRDLALTSGANVVSDTLAVGLEYKNVPVAIGTLGAMAAMGARHPLLGAGADRSPLLAALDYPNPDVQYAAAVAILQADPDRHFRGAQRVVSVLTRAISGTSTPFAVVIDSNRARGNEMAGLIGQSGFETIAADTGREGFAIASAQSNVVLVVIHANVIRWPLSQTLSNLHADARTAHIPILIYGPEWVRAHLTMALSYYPHIDFVSESPSNRGLELQAGEFLKSALSLAEPPTARAGQLADAVGWLAQIANRNRTNIFSLDPATDALIGLSTDRHLYANVLAALAGIPTGAVQHQFEQLATGERLEVPIRIAAARQLVIHIQRHGLLLTAADAAELERAWRSATDPELETALAVVVGSLKPNAKRIATRLQSAASARRLAP